MPGSRPTQENQRSSPRAMSAGRFSAARVSAAPPSAPPAAAASMAATVAAAQACGVAAAQKPRASSRLVQQRGDRRAYRPPRASVLRARAARARGCWGVGVRGWRGTGGAERPRASASSGGGMPWHRAATPAATKCRIAACSRRYRATRGEPSSVTRMPTGCRTGWGGSGVEGRAGRGGTGKRGPGGAGGEGGRGEDALSCLRLEVVRLSREEQRRRVVSGRAPRSRGEGEALRGRHLFSAAAA